MATYTGVADANGGFTVPFSSSYTGGQKVTVTAEKGAATKTIELFAPSEVVGNKPNIEVSGNWDNFPANIGTVTITVSGTIASSAFWYKGDNYGFSNATNLEIKGCSGIGLYAFKSWKKMTSLTLDVSVKIIDGFAFESCSALLNIVLPGVVNVGVGAFRYCGAVLSVDIGTAIITIGGAAFEYLSSCNQVICRALSPPTIESNSFGNIKSTCIFKVPAESVAAYQAAPGWSGYAARIQAI
ncbi:MAG: leucine-rich repeat protein [Acinetobacter sp.]